METELTIKGEVTNKSTRFIPARLLQKKQHKALRVQMSKQLQSSPFRLLISTSFPLCWFNFCDFAVSAPSLAFVNASSLTADRLKRIDCNCFGWHFA